MNRELIDFFVLDALVNDFESMEDILRILNSTSDIGWRDFHPLPFTIHEVLAAVQRGVAEGNIQVYIYSSTAGGLSECAAEQLGTTDYSELWFALTAKGHETHSQWDPPL